MSLPAVTAELFTVPRTRPGPTRRPPADGAPRRATEPVERRRAERSVRGAGATRSGDRPSGAAPSGVGPDVSGPSAGGPEGRAVPPGPPPARAVVALLESARDELRAAQVAADPAERFRSAHLGALRAAAAVLAVRARSRRSSRPTDAWSLLATVAPEHAEWAGFFAAHSATRSVVEAGVRGRVSQREADDMVRQADLFLAIITRTVAGRAAPRE